MSETLGQIPLLEAASQELKQNGSFHTDLTAPQLTDLMRSVISDLTQNQSQVQASVPTLEVKIANNVGQVSGSIFIQKPVEAQIHIGCSFENDPDDTAKINLNTLNIDEQAGFTAKMLLSAADVQGKARKLLSDPNHALFNNLEQQLLEKRVRLTDMGLHFYNNTLWIGLVGHDSSTKVEVEQISQSESKVESSEMITRRDLLIGTAVMALLGIAPFALGSLTRDRKLNSPTSTPTKTSLNTPTPKPIIEKTG